MISDNYFFNKKNLKQDIYRLEKRRNKIKENIDLIDQRISEYVEKIDVPLQIIKSRRKSEKELEEVEIELDSKKYILKQQPKIPDLLPYLPNRKDQEAELDNLLQKYFQDTNNKPIICIVHGDKSQGHDYFIRRIREVFLPTRFKPDERPPIKPYYISCPNYKNNKDDFHDQLRRILATKITDYAFNSTQEINNFLSSQYTLIHVSIHLSAGDWNRINFIEFFLEFWQQWTSMCSDQFLMVCLSITYPKENNLSFCKIYQRYRLRKMKHKFIFRLEQYFSAKLNKFDRIMGTVLPELKGIKQVHLDNWLSEEVNDKFQDNRVTEHLKHQINFLYKTWNKKKKSKEIPMDYIAAKLGKLLEGDSVQEEDIA